MTKWFIVSISTGQKVGGPFDSRGAANQHRWSNYEDGHSNDKDYEQEYGVVKETEL